MVVEKGVIKTFDVLLHRPPAVEAIFPAHPFATFPNIQVQIFLVLLRPNACGPIEEVGFVLCCPYIAGDGGRPIIRIGLGNKLALGTISAEVVAVENKAHAVGFLWIIDALYETPSEQIRVVMNEPEVANRLVL